MSEANLGGLEAGERTEEELAGVGGGDDGALPWGEGQRRDRVLSPPTHQCRWARLTQT